MTSHIQSENTTASFDLHTIGAGYLYRLRKVTINRGTPYWAVTLGVLHGLRDKQTGRFEVTYFDCRIVGELAIKRIEELVDAGYFVKYSNSNQYEAKASLFICFKLGDIKSGFYWKEDQGNKVPVPTISGRLLQIRSAKIKQSNQQTSSVFEFANQPRSLTTDQDDQPENLAKSNQPKYEQSIGQNANCINSQNVKSSHSTTKPEVFDMTAIEYGFY